MLAELLRAELGFLIVELGDAQLSAKGHAIDIRRRFVVLDQLENYLRLGVFEDPGVQTHFQVRRVGDELIFKCMDSPWRGHGTLQLASTTAREVDGENSPEGSNLNDHDAPAKADGSGVRVIGSSDH